MLSTVQGFRVASSPSATVRPSSRTVRSFQARTAVRASAVQRKTNAGKNGAKYLSTWLLKEELAGRVDNELAVVLQSISVACKEISCLVKNAPIAGMTGVADSTNASGDEQKKLDLVANEVFCRCVADSGRTGIVVTEEEDTPIAVESTSDGQYIVCFDPIDGSSNIDACVTTGSIFAIYSREQDTCKVDWSADGDDEILEKCLTNVRKSGKELVAAGYCMYSSSTVFMLTVGDGVYGFTLDSGNTGEFILSHDNIKIPEPGAGGQNIYSGNNGNVNLWAPELKEYVQHLQQSGSSYRYIGALVGDFHRTLLYGGIWLYPPDIKAPNGKARLLYEVAPMSMIAEQAGGMSTWGPMADDRVLEVVPQTVHQKSPMFVGSTGEVKRLQAFLAAKKN